MSDKVSLRTAQAERLRMAREAAGFKRATDALTRNPIWKQSTYLAHENGQNGLTADSAIRYGAAFGVDPGWLLTGRGKMKETEQFNKNIGSLDHTKHDVEIVTKGSPDIGFVNVEKVERLGAPDFFEEQLDLGRMRRDVPIYGSAACGKDGLFAMNGQTLDYARRPPRLAGIKDAYALYISGDSVSPWREDGDLVYVHPHAPVKINDWVVVQLYPKSAGEPGAAFVKRLVRRTAKEIILLQYNPRREISLKAAEVHQIHRILDWSELMGI